MPKKTVKGGLFDEIHGYNPSDFALSKYVCKQGKVIWNEDGLKIVDTVKSISVKHDSSKCQICGTHIVHQYQIDDGDVRAIVGSECVLEFMPLAESSVKIVKTYIAANQRRTKEKEAAEKLRAKIQEIRKNVYCNGAVIVAKDDPAYRGTIRITLDAIARSINDFYTSGHNPKDIDRAIEEIDNCFVFVKPLELIKLNRWHDRVTEKDIVDFLTSDETKALSDFEWLQLVRNNANELFFKILSSRKKR